MPNNTQGDIRGALDAFTNTPDIDDGLVYEHEEIRALQVLAEEVRAFIDANPNFEQANALLAQVRKNAPMGTFVVSEPFDLPPGYVQATEQLAHGFTCGIAPDGRVSS